MDALQARNEGQNQVKRMCLRAAGRQAGEVSEWKINRAPTMQ